MTDTIGALILFIGRSDEKGDLEHALVGDYLRLHCLKIEGT